MTERVAGFTVGVAAGMIVFGLWIAWDSTRDDGERMPRLEKWRVV